MRLGLWMSPMSFHPESRAYRSHPDWACTPVGHGTAAANALQPDDGSNEAGIGLWSPAALPHVEGAIRRAIEQWGVSYFKFDFLVWLDCAGQGDLYDYHDAFVRMLDRVRADHPSVTFQIDETNDYRMFPFESVARGPSWFQNGSPGPERLLHNLWNLSPYVPAFSIGQHMLGGGHWREHPVDTLMAASLLSHATFFSDLRDLPAEVIDAAAPWAEWHKTRRHLLDGVVYPLLDDPLEGGWTALQAWDPREGSGALVAFRQDSDEPARTVALRNVPPGRTFTLALAPSGTPLGSVTSEQLSGGIEVQIPERRGAYVVSIEPG
jgi:alpha-galactosidase